MGQATNGATGATFSIQVGSAANPTPTPTPTPTPMPTPTPTLPTASLYYQASTGTYFSIPSSVRLTDGGQVILIDKTDQMSGQVVGFVDYGTNNVSTLVSPNPLGVPAGGQATMSFVCCTVVAKKYNLTLTDQ